MLMLQEVEINRIIMLGEEERGDQQRYQTFCFVTSLGGNDYISADAMSKLRQVSSIVCMMAGHVIIFFVCALH